MASRIGTIIGAAAIMALAAWSPATAAEDFDATAYAFIEALSDEVAEVATDSDIAADERDARIQTMFDERVDIRTIARFILGPHWRTAGDDERDEFTAVFRGLMVNAVAKHAGRFLSAPMEIERVVPVENAKRPEALVMCRIKTASGSTMPLAWRVRAGDHGPQVVDIVFNGISLIMTKRDEYQSVLRSNSGDVSALIAQMKALGQGDAAIAANKD